MRMTHCRRSTANTAAPSVNINHSHLGSIENSRQLKMSDWRLARASVHKNMLEIPTQTTKIMLHLWLLRYKSATLRNNARPSATQTCSAYQPYRIWQHFDYNHTKPTLATTERGTYALVLPTPSWNPPSSSQTHRHPTTPLVTLEFPCLPQSLQLSGVRVYVQSHFSSIGAGRKTNVSRDFVLSSYNREQMCTLLEAITASTLCSR